MFAKAASLTPTIKAGAAGKARKEIPIDGLFAYANIDAAIKALEGLKASYEPKVKGLAFDSFMTLCTADNKKPESFTGTDGDATASMELRKRGTNSPLKEEEQALLLSNGFTPIKQLVTQQLFAINPKYAADAKLLGSVEAALSKVKGLPEDFIVQQDEVSKMVVSEANVDEVFAARPKLNKDTFEQLVKIVTTQAVKPKLAETDFNNVMAKIAKLLTATTTEVEEA
jgi:hypothetical protein